MRKRSGWMAAVVVCVVAAGGGLAAQGGNARTLKNPVKSTPESIKAGQQAFNGMCRQCHGPLGRGDGMMASKTQPPSDLTDGTWDHGATDGEIFAVIANGVPKEKTLMKGIKGKVADTDIWNIVNYIRSLEERRAKSDAKKG